MNHPAPAALRGFFDRLVRQKNTTVIKVISDSFGVDVDGREFSWLMESQKSSYIRLIQQIELSDAGTQTKEISLKQIHRLSQFVGHGSMNKIYDPVKVEIIDPNYHALTYVEEFLKLSPVDAPDFSGSIEEIKQQLKVFLEEIRTQSLPGYVRGALYSQISRLIFFLENYDIIGSDQVWEASSAALVTIHRDLPLIEGQNAEKSVAGLGLVLTRLVAVLATISVGAQQIDSTLTHVDSALEHSESIGKRLKRGYDYIENLRKPIPQIEDHSKKEKTGSIDV